MSASKAHKSHSIGVSSRETGIKLGALKPSLHQFWISRINREQNGKLW